MKLLVFFDKLIIHLISNFLFLKANVVIEQFSTKLVSHTNFPSPNFFTNNKCGNPSTCQTLIVYLVHIF